LCQTRRHMFLIRIFNKSKLEIIGIHHVRRIAKENQIGVQYLHIQEEHQSRSVDKIGQQPPWVVHGYHSFCEQSASLGQVSEQLGARN